MIVTLYQWKHVCRDGVTITNERVPLCPPHAEYHMRAFITLGTHVARSQTSERCLSCYLEEVQPSPPREEVEAAIRASLASGKMHEPHPGQTCDEAHGKGRSAQGHE